MAKQTVSATTKDSDRTVSVQYDFGDNLADAVKKFGEAVVFNNFEAQATISLQSRIRSGIKPNKDGKTLTDAEIQKMADEWKPGMKTIVRKSAQEKIKDAFSGMSAEDRAAMLKELKAQMQAEKAA